MMRRVVGILGFAVMTAFALGAPAAGAAPIQNVSVDLNIVPITDSSINLDVDVFGNPAAPPAQDIDVTITLSVPATSVTLTEQEPAGSNAQCSAGATAFIIHCTAPALIDFDGQQLVALVVQTGFASIPPARSTAGVGVTTSSPDADPTDNHDSAFFGGTQHVGNQSVAITGSPTTVVKGDHVLITVTIKNLDTEGVRPILEYSYSFEDGLEPLDEPDECIDDGGGGDCDFAPLPGGQSITTHFTMRVAGYRYPELHFTGSVGVFGDTDPSDDHATVIFHFAPRATTTSGASTTIAPTPQASSSADALATTGTPVGAGLGVAAVTLAIGGLLMLMGRRRPRRAH